MAQKFGTPTLTSLIDMAANGCTAQVLFSSYLSNSGYRVSWANLRHFLQSKRTYLDADHADAVRL